MRAIRNDLRSVGAELFDLHFFRPCRFRVGAGRDEHRLDNEVKAADEVLVGREGRRPRRAAVHFPGEALGFFRHRFGTVIVSPGSNEASRKGLRAHCTGNGELALDGVLDADTLGRESGALALLNEGEKP